ncbi:MAG: hypothetical protein ACD_78C00153G0001 [uncultured bacterium (gcode 4)]|uniref:Uncharacterized protein n=1 Tax=uncultured bacterium (gcode 4) TaxID=1234023 RepID=K1XIG0_9BACT|nr:MAG: hypothetical protein ACD_78C00153G0001 [uncultured bacterium (gcode 4)]
MARQNSDQYACFRIDNRQDIYPELLHKFFRIIAWSGVVSEYIRDKMNILQRQISDSFIFF